MPRSLHLDNKTSDFSKTVKLCQKNKTSTANSANKFYFPLNFLVEKILFIWANHWMQRSHFFLVCFFFYQSTLFSPSIIKSVACDIPWVGWLYLKLPLNDVGAALGGGTYKTPFVGPYPWVPPYRHLRVWASFRVHWFPLGWHAFNRVWSLAHCRPAPSFWGFVHPRVGVPLMYWCCTRVRRCVCVRELKVRGQNMDRIASWSECCVMSFFHTRAGLWIMDTDT